MIEVKHLTYTYRRASHHALDDVSLSFPQAEFCCLAGPNGSGKSTLARHLNALLVPASGHVLVDGMDTRDAAQLATIHRAVGMVFQDPDEQIVGTTIEEEVAFGPEVQGVPSARIRELVDKALAFTGLEDRRFCSPIELSGGQRQRLEIAGAIACEARYLVLDEATSMLDTRGRSLVVETLLRLRDERGMGIVLVTHEMDEVAHADRVVAMGDGRVAFEGTPAELFADKGRLYGLGLTDSDCVSIARPLLESGAFSALPLTEGELFAASEEAISSCRC